MKRSQWRIAVSVACLAAACVVCGCAGERSEEAPPVEDGAKAKVAAGAKLTGDEPVPHEGGEPGVTELPPEGSRPDGPALVGPITGGPLPSPGAATSSPGLRIPDRRPLQPLDVGGANSSSGHVARLPGEISTAIAPRPTTATPRETAAIEGPDELGPRVAAMRAEEPDEAAPEDEGEARGDDEGELVEEPSESAPEDTGFTRVKVYYGTDRARNESGGPGVLARYPLQSWLLVSAGITIFLAAIACFVPKRRALRGAVVAGVLATAGLGLTTAWSRFDGGSSELTPDEFYGNDRGTLELGSCEVSIPEDHQTGELESPSIFKLDFTENPKRHVVLLGVRPQSEDEFFAECREQVTQSKRQEAMVFVHGYNVSFEDAARRTAQLAYDLKFDGAPIFYSWPSQAGLLQYAVDETNAVWTVPNLKEFLVQVTQRSGAKSVHLIAHSMGNRALTSALYNLSYELGKDAKIFHDVVLTAPDIDAAVFRRDIAPAIVKTAERVTLYASSKDEALALSKTLHGYPRAGDSGSDLVVVPGIDTIDVSAVDTSLLGHSYYGSNDTVLTDLAELLLAAKPPHQRPWLRSVPSGALRYWVLLREQIGTGAGSPLWR